MSTEIRMNGATSSGCGAAGAVHACVPYQMPLTMGKLENSIEQLVQCWRFLGPWQPQTELLFQGGGCLRKAGNAVVEGRGLAVLKLEREARARCRSGDQMVLPGPVHPAKTHARVQHETPEPGSGSAVQDVLKTSSHENSGINPSHKISMEDPPTQDPIAELITNYNELNSSVVEEFHEDPSALEFMRYVARNTPFVVRGAAADWQATKTWTVDYLKDFLGDEPVNVAVTPRGYAHTHVYTHTHTPYHTPSNPPIATPTPQPPSSPPAP